MINTTTTTNEKVPYHETKWRTLNIRPTIKDMLAEIAAAMGNGYTAVPLCRALEDLIVAKHSEYFPKG